MERLTDEEYGVIEAFITAVLKRVEQGQFDASKGRAEIMHPFTALFDGSPQDVLPYIRRRLEQWSRGDADQT